MPNLYKDVFAKGTVSSFKLISPAEQYNANKVPSSSNICDLLTLLEYNASPPG